VALLACVWQLAPRTTAWRTALALGGVVTLVVMRERISAGKHWPTDVLVGAALGAAIGATLGRGAPQ
jgi:membrane-associated phospholipid phosphatase